MKLLHYVVGPIQTNCYTLVSDKNQGIVIDPGASGDSIAAELKKNQVTPVAVLLTHGHFDHVSGVEDLCSHYDSLPVYILEQEMDTLRDPELNLSAVMSYEAKDFSGLITDTFKDGEEKTIAGFKFKVIWTPGHTPGGCSYYFPDLKLLFPGDTLFCESAGRTDFKGGSFSDEVHSIKEKLLTLPEDTTVYPGHDSNTTIAFEKINNPYA
ncbi:MAG: MBL fold metallo-hydrolase [Lachnospiraceae bacterium]|uniref:MBL fold metallo-hydrolase n=1 Tax=Candidatus Weimeria bifida TaxID=2599074 RepID=A0A6N7IZK7_9FIRM|nr:MBL fold metallo-hydrolase [Candidatus Weimeria bifida]RRF96661.1 MAG: MBL fold metallo-hydrolase [Lachnospiraceae bacterium]